MPDTISTIDSSGGPSAATAIQPVAHETADRIITGLVTVVPMVMLGFVAWQVWNSALHASDLIVFGIVYALTGLGITVGFHRLLTHRSFKTSAAVRGFLAALGSAAIEGPVISWVADHRKHHACSDQEGDPHSPHVGHGGGLWGSLKGLFHAHVGWLFIHTQRGSKQRFAPDLLDDPVIRFVDRTFLLWAVIGLAVPFGLGVAIGGTVTAGLWGLLWGGAVRVFVLHHVTYSINSLCHVFGRQPFQTGDESRNLAWLAPLSFRVKLEMFFRLTGNISYPLMIVASFLQFPLLLVRYNQPFYHLMILDLPLLFFSSISVALFYGTAVWYLDKKRTPRMLHLPLVIALGIGLAFSNARAVLEALFGVKSDFIRTPKYRVENTADATWKGKKYKRKRGLLPLLELSFAVYFMLAIVYSARLHMWGTIPFLTLFFFGFGYMGVMSLVQTASGKRFLSFWRPAPADRRP